MSARRMSASPIVTGRGSARGSAKGSERGSEKAEIANIRSLARSDSLATCDNTRMTEEKQMPRSMMTCLLLSFVDSICVYFVFGLTNSKRKRDEVPDGRKEEQKKRHIATEDEKRKESDSKKEGSSMDEKAEKLKRRMAEEKKIISDREEKSGKK